jgi:hypothetical protein
MSTCAALPPSFSLASIPFAASSSAVDSVAGHWLTGTVSRVLGLMTHRLSLLNVFIRAANGGDL